MKSKSHSALFLFVTLLMFSIASVSVLGNVNVTINPFLDLDIDSNNDSIIDETDEPVELIDPGKLIYLNQDDDNKNDMQDRLDTGASVTDEDDLQPIKIVFCNIPSGKVILSATSGGSLIRVWRNPNRSDEVLLPMTWTARKDAVSITLYVEGFETGPAQLKLAWVDNEIQKLSDEVKLGVVKIDFKQRSDTRYGYDNGLNTYPVPKSAENSPQKYDWVNVENGGKTTDVNVEITPAVYAPYVYFINPGNGYNAECYPDRAAGSPQKLTITGNAAGETYIRTWLGTRVGAKGNRLNVACYNMVSIQANYFTVGVGTLLPVTVTGADLSTMANEFLMQIVARLVLFDNGVKPVNYDDNSDGYLDINTDASDYGIEWVKVTNALNTVPGSKNVIYVKKLSITEKAISKNIAGYRFVKDNVTYLIITENASSNVILVHEMLHAAGLGDVGPGSNNELNVMFWMVAESSFLGYFKVECCETGIGKSYPVKQYQQQWKTIQR